MSTKTVKSQCLSFLLRFYFIWFNFDCLAIDMGRKKEKKATQNTWVSCNFAILEQALAYTSVNYGFCELKLLRY